MNTVKTAARIANEQKKLKEATDTERRKLAREQFAATGRNKGKNATAAAGLLKKKKTRNIRFAEKGISATTAEKAETKRKRKAIEKRVKLARKEQAKSNNAQKALNARQAKAKAKKAKAAKPKQVVPLAVRRMQNTSGYRGISNNLPEKRPRKPPQRLGN